MCRGSLAGVRGDVNVSLGLPVCACSCVPGCVCTWACVRVHAGLGLCVRACERERQRVESGWR